MKRRFYVKIELDLHAITCPGVWLCPSGYLEATIKTLGYFFKTGPLEPKFPVLCHDQFLMEGYFKSISTYSELERIIWNEKLVISLWQSGRRLAHFSGNLGQIMQPSLQTLSCYHNVNVQLLMIPSKNFPGIIAPKLELSSKVIIKDRNSSSKAPIAAFETTPSAFVPCFSGRLNAPSNYRNDFTADFRRQKPVCHTKKDFKWHREKELFPSDRIVTWPQTSVPKDLYSCKRCSTKSTSSPDSENLRQSSGSNSSQTRLSFCSSSIPSFPSIFDYKSNEQQFFGDCNFEFDHEHRCKDCKICHSYDMAFKEFRY